MLNLHLGAQIANCGCTLRIRMPCNVALTFSVYLDHASTQPVKEQESRGTGDQMPLTPSRGKNFSAVKFVCALY